MKRKRLLTKMMAGATTVVVLILFLLILGAADIPTESFEAADGRGYILMSIDSVQGPEGPPYPDHIKVLDYTLELENVGTQGATGDRYRSEARFSKISVVKNIDKTSPLLAKLCSRGDVIQTIEIKLIPDPLPPTGVNHYYIITLEDAVISSVKDRVVHRESDGAFAHVEELEFRSNRVILLDIGSGETHDWDIEHNREY